MTSFEFVTVGELQEGDTFVLNVNSPAHDWVKRVVARVVNGTVVYDRNGEEVTLRRMNLEVVKVKR